MTGPTKGTTKVAGRRNLWEPMAIYRTNKGWTQAEVADAAQMSRSLYSRRESGKKGEPKLRSLKRIKVGLMRDKRINPSEFDQQVIFPIIELIEIDDHDA